MLKKNNMGFKRGSEGERDLKIRKGGGKKETIKGTEKRNVGSELKKNKKEGREGRGVK